MIYDPTIEVACDGENCRQSTDIQPAFVYRTMAGTSGYYDTSDSAIEIKLAGQGWAAVHGKHYCESCAAEAAEKGRP